MKIKDTPESQCFHLVVLEVVDTGTWILVDPTESQPERANNDVQAVAPHVAFVGVVLLGKTAIGMFIPRGQASGTDTLPSLSHHVASANFFMISNDTFSDEGDISSGAVHAKLQQALRSSPDKVKDSFNFSLP